jgi:hypothetical protein
MADGKQTYPMLPISHWWALRKKFRQSLPGVVTDGYLASVLNMEARSAQVNVLPYLKRLGIIDDDAKTGERAKRWRDDGHYPKVCREILEEIYPEELRAAVTELGQRSAAERWFAHETANGEAAARRMAALYMVLLEADASKQPDEQPDQPKKPGKDRVTKPKEATKNVRPTSTVHTPVGETPNHNRPPAPLAPGININLEIHISADSTTEQIDQIFASMAKHIYKAS